MTFASLTILGLSCAIIKFSSSLIIINALTGRAGRRYYMMGTLTRGGCDDKSSSVENLASVWRAVMINN